MKSLSLLVILLCISFNAYCADEFVDYFEYEQSYVPKDADDITKHFTKDSELFSKQLIELFQSYEKNLDRELSSNAKQPVIWFVKGLNYKNMLNMLDAQKQLGARNILPIIHQTQQSMEQAFNQSILLDNAKKKKLTATMYATMKHHLNQSDRINALQKELELGGSGDNESQYWFTHWDVIGSLQQQQRYEEAENALYKMKKELKKAGLNDSDFNQIYQSAKSNLESEHTLDEELKAEAESEDKPKQKPTPEQTASQPEAKQLFTKLQEKISSYWLMILINVIVIISLIVAFIKREK